MGFRELNLGYLHARQEPYPLHYLSGPMIYILIGTTLVFLGAEVMYILQAAAILLARLIWTGEG